MAKISRDSSLEAFALRISIAGLCAVIMAVVILGLTITPAHRGGNPVLAGLLDDILSSLGMKPFHQDLAGQNQILLDLTGATPLKARFLVRFENAPEAEKALRVFRENRTQGRTMFSEWAETTENFKGFRLAAMTPAGEAVLAYDADLPKGDLAATLITMERNLKNSPGVAYADPYPFNPTSGSKG